MTINCWPWETTSPILQEISLTLPSLSAVITFSSFIASSVRSFWPFFTLSPTLTLTPIICPGIGAVIVTSPSDSGEDLADGKGVGEVFVVAVVWELRQQLLHQLREKG